MEYPNRMMKVSELRLADVVELGGKDGFNTAIVKRVTEDEVTFFRPYGTTADFEYTGGVICYVGIEEFPVRKDSSHEFKVLSRRELA